MEEEKPEKKRDEYVNFQEYEKLREEKEKLEKENLQLRTELTNLKLKNRSNSVNKIRLNIGGKLFTTSITTLTNEKDTFFTSMLGKNFNTQPDEDGEYFIDRNPEYFHIILDYLRNPTKELDLSDLNPKQLKEFQYEVDFYSIRSLQIEPQKIIEIVSIGDKLSVKKLDVNKYRISKSNSNVWDANITFSSCRKFKITSIQNCVSLAIGVIKKENLNVNDMNMFQGYFILSNGGTLCSKNGDNSKPYGKSFYYSGNLIETIYENNTLSFVIQGKNYGIAYKGLDDNLLPSIDVGSASACFDIEFFNK